MELYQEAQATLRARWSHTLSWVNDVLRRAFYKGKISSISSIRTMLHPQGLLLTCQATVQTSYDRRIAAHVLLAIAAGPMILGYLPLPSHDMARQLVEKWNPSYNPLGCPKMHASIACMLGVHDATRVRGVSNAALKAKLIRPVGDYLRAQEVHNFLVRLPPADALSVLRELQQPMEATLPVSKPATLDELHCALLAWAGSFSSFTLGAPFSKWAPILDVFSAETVAPACEASLIPVASYADLRCIPRDAIVPWATTLVVAILEHGHRPMLTLSKWFRLYVPGTAFSLASSTSNSLWSPPFISTPRAEPIAIDDEPAVTAALLCLNSLRLQLTSHAPRMLPWYRLRNPTQWIGLLPFCLNACFLIRRWAIPWIMRLMASSTGSVSSTSMSCTGSGMNISLSCRCSRCTTMPRCKCETIPMIPPSATCESG